MIYITSMPAIALWCLVSGVAKCSGEDCAVLVDSQLLQLPDTANLSPKTFSNVGRNARNVRVHDGPPDSWQQVGSSIDGRTAGEMHGETVCLSDDGNRIAIGARNNHNDAGTYAGQVRVYDWTGSGWEQVGADINGRSQSIFGSALSMSADGNRVVGGGCKAGSGFAAVYDWSGTEWQQVGTFEGDNVGDYLGYSVSLSADGARLALGSIFADSDVASNCGKVSVYDWSGGAWQKVGEDIWGVAANERAGASLSLSADGSRLAFGAPYYNAGALAWTGQVRVYDWTGSVWQQVGSSIEGEGAQDYCGEVSLGGPSGTRLAVGAQSNDGAGPNAGHVRVYDWSGSAWQQVGEDIEGASAGDHFGHRMSFSADASRVAIGASYANIHQGVVRVYDWSGSEWQQLGVELSGGQAMDQFGKVSLSANGIRLAIGAPRAASSGFVSIYDWTGESRGFSHSAAPRAKALRAIEGH